jgi:hypothetical protein
MRDMKDDYDLVFDSGLAASPTGDEIELVVGGYL